METTPTRTSRARPLVGRGFKVSVPQDYVIERLMRKTGKNFTELMHAALETYAGQLGEQWPDEEPASTKAS